MEGDRSQPNTCIASIKRPHLYYFIVLVRQELPDKIIHLSYAPLALFLALPHTLSDLPFEPRSIIPPLYGRIQIRWTFIIRIRQH